MDPNSSRAISLKGYFLELNFSPKNNCARRFKGSTLQVMGANDENEENEWAIVGGTGEFSMARGIISRRVYSFIFTQLTQELNIEFFCRMTVSIIN